MTIKYDKETDIVYFGFNDKLVAESEEKRPGIILDFDEEGNIVGIELLEASKKIGKPGSVIYEFV